MANDPRMHGECEQTLEVSANVRQMFVEKNTLGDYLPNIRRKSFLLDQSPSIRRKIVSFGTVGQTFAKNL